MTEEDCCEAHGLLRPCDDCAEQGVIELAIHECVVEERDALLAERDAKQTSAKNSKGEAACDILTRLATAAMALNVAHELYWNDEHPDGSCGPWTNICGVELGDLATRVDNFLDEARKADLKS